MVAFAVEHGPQLCLCFHGVANPNLGVEACDKASGRHRLVRQGSLVRLGHVFPRHAPHGSALSRAGLKKAVSDAGDQPNSAIC